jgi:hypothetical protein
LPEKKPKPGRRPSLLDAAKANLVSLIGDRDANLASGTFGVLIVLDRGQHRHIKIYQEQTVDLTAADPQ